jgi:hypothetical protein
VNWWEQAPLVNQQQGGNWWEAAPLVAAAGNAAAAGAAGAQPQGAGIVANIGAGASRGLYGDVLGGASELVNAGLGLVGLGSERPVGGSEDLRSVSDFIANAPARYAATRDAAIKQGQVTDPSQAGDLVAGALSPSAWRDHGAIHKDARVEPVTEDEQIAYAGGRAGGQAMGSIAGGHLLAQANNPMVQTIGQTLKAAPVRQVVASGAGGAVGEATDNPWLGLATALLTAGGMTVLKEGGQLLGTSLKNASGLANPDKTAARIAGRSFRRDGVNRLIPALDDLGDDAVLADVGGRNVRGTVRAAAGQPGPASQYADDFLSARRADEPARLAAAIRNNVSPEDGFTSTIDDIVAQRSAKAAPLYEQAGIPKDAAQYGNSPRLISPEVKTLIEKSKDVQSAIAQAKSLPQYADLPNDSIVLLDKAYKNIGGKAEAAKRAGDAVAYRDLNELRQQLKDAIVNERPAYGDALKTFADDSGLKNAIEQGRKLFASNADAEVVAKTYSQLAPDEKLLFRQGVAEHLRDTASRSQTGSPAAKAFGGPKNQAKLKMVLGEDYDEFAKAMGREKTFNRTASDISSGSRTAPMLAEQDDLASQIGGAARSAAGGDFWGAVSRIGGNVGSRVAEGRNERVNEALVKMLLNPDRQARQTVAAKIAQEQMRQQLAQILMRQQAVGTFAAPAMPRD